MNKAPVYPIDAWQVRETTFDPDQHLRSESIFALGNGFIGVRGAFEEGFSAGSRIASAPGTFLNGFYESAPIRYPEPGFGYAKNSQTMLNVTDAKTIRVWVDDEPFHLDCGEILNYERVLDLQTGILTRQVRWRSAAGVEIDVHIRRVVSFDQPHLAAVEFRITPVNGDARITLHSLLDGDIVNQTSQPVRKDGHTAAEDEDIDPRIGSPLEGRVLQVDALRTHESLLSIQQHARHSKLALACAVEHDLQTDNPFAIDLQRLSDAAGEETGAAMIYMVQAQSGVPVTLTKVIAYVTNQTKPKADLLAQAEALATAGKARGFTALVDAHVAVVRKFWAGAEISIDGDDALQQGIRFNMFHLLGAAGKDGVTNIGAKGLTGEGYEGHYFWDTEMFVIPYFMYVDPSVSRSLLSYRYTTLDKARARARELSHNKGAAYPWRTINGEEASAFFPAGSAQYHINADIAYAIKAYVETTGDTEFLIQQGAEILFETARLWADLGEYVPARGNQFCIYGVTGPDEYTALVDNNCYTNLMAQMHLRYAVQVARWLAAAQPEAYAALVRRLNLTLQELSEWHTAAEQMYIPYDPNTGLYPADDGFLHRASWRWDWGTRDGLEPLLKRYHYLVVYRHQVCKQADLVLALFLLPDRFTREEKRRNFNYYEQITTHDSSLSTCTFSIVASEIGYQRRAYEYFLRTARMDLDDYHGNVTHGVHIANMAGTWMCLVNGFAGLRMSSGSEIGEGVPHYRPYLPEELRGYSFKVRHGDATVQVTVSRGQVVYELVDDGAVTLRHFDTQIDLDANQRRWVFESAV